MAVTELDRQHGSSVATSCKCRAKYERVQAADAQRLL
jgi:hypothetical protein